MTAADQAFLVEIGWVRVDADGKLHETMDATDVPDDPDVLSVLLSPCQVCLAERTQYPDSVRRGTVTDAD